MSTRFLLVFFLSALTVIAQSSEQLKSVATVADLIARRPVSNERLSVSGWRAAGDWGAQRTVRHVPSSVAATNYGAVFACAGTGRYLAEDCGSGSVDVRWFASGTNVANNSPYIQAAIDYVATLSTFGGGNKQVVRLPNGQWKVGSTIVLSNSVAFRGEAVEAIGANIVDYPLNGSVIVSEITDGSPVIKVQGIEGDPTTSYLSGIEISNIGIDGNGSEGDGIWLDSTAGTHDILWERIIVRKVGGSAFRSGDGTEDGSPHLLYSTFRQLRAIMPERDGFEFSSGTLYTVSLVLDDLYCNGAGRNGFNISGLGYCEAHNWNENNSAQLEDGDGIYMRNVDSATFYNLIAEGDGRAQDAGDSVEPIFSSRAMRLEGVTGSSFIGCVLSGPSGNIVSPSSSAVLELASSVAADGYSARDCIANRFEQTTIKGYSTALFAPSGAVGAGGSLSAGIYRYRVIATYDGGWGVPLCESAELTIRAAASDKVELTSVPIARSSIGSRALVDRRIYRTAADGSVFKLLTTIADNTTTAFSDTVADSALGAASDHYSLILLDSSASLNRFVQTQVDTLPIISDSGLKNSFDAIYTKTLSPVVMPYIGPGSFGDQVSTASQGARHWFGADRGGMADGWGITLQTDHSTSFILPHYQTSRHGSVGVGFVGAYSTVASNVISLGSGAHDDYGATHVGIWTHPSVTSSNRVLQQEVTANGTRFVNNATLSNSKYIYSDDLSGTPHVAVGVGGDNILTVGSSTLRMAIRPSASGLYLGEPGASAPIYIARRETATEVDPLQYSQLLSYIASAWSTNGTNAQAIQWDTYYIATATNGATLVHTNGPTAKFVMAPDGVVGFEFWNTGLFSVLTTNGIIRTHSLVATNSIVLGATTVTNFSSLLNWTNLTDVPAGFADGTDDGGVGSGAPAAVNSTNLSSLNLLSVAPFNWAISASTNAFLTNATLYAFAEATGGTSTNFWAGDLSYKQVTTNMVPGLNGMLGTLAAPGTWQPTNATLTRIAGIGAGSSADIIRHDGTGWTNTPGLTHFESAGAVSSHSALTNAVHGVSVYGASLTAEANATDARSRLGLGTAAVQAATDFQGTNANLTTLAGGEGGFLTAASNATNAQQFVTLSQLQSASAGGQASYFNLAQPAIGYGGFTAATTNINSLTPIATATTNLGTALTTGDYAAFFISTNTYASLSDGLAVVSLYACESAAGSPTIKAEVYLINAVTKLIEYEYEPSPAFQAVVNSVTPAGLVFSVPITARATGTNVYVAIGVKLGANGTVRLATGGAYDAHVTFPLPSSAFVMKSGDTMTGALNVPDVAYGIGWDTSTAVPTRNAVYDKIEGLSSVYQGLDADLTALAGGNAMATLITNTASLGSPTIYLGSTNLAPALALKAPLADPVFTGSLQLPNSDDPDVDAAGELSWDTDGWLRAYDGANQVAVGRKIVQIDVPVYKPNDFDDAQRDALWIWSNRSGMPFVITSWSAESTSDNTDFTIKTMTSSGGSITTVDAVSITTDGTSMFYATDPDGITSATIASGNIIFLDFDDTDAPAMVHITIIGYYNADVN